ncbi:MAG: isoprenylcysteine carboxylmethyltransferase family protein, partial [Nanoarchaeota archaeon]
FSVFVVILENHQLITKGPYAYVRHPIYSAGILKAFGFVLVTNSFLGLFALLFLLIPALLYRLRVEEKVLVGHFGQVYLRYKKRVKAIIPYIF